MDLLQHLKSRNFDIDRYPVVWLDHSENLVTLPLWNLSGQLVGYQQYRPGASKAKANHPRDGRYYTRHGKGVLAVWGLESYHYRQDVLFIVEGVFDACVLHRLNIPAVALLNSSSLPYQEWLDSTGRRVIKVEDTDSKKSLDLGPYSNIAIPEHRGDLGDCTLTEVRDMLDFLL